MAKYVDLNTNKIIDDCFRASLLTKFERQVSATVHDWKPQNGQIGALGITFDYISPNVEVKRERYTITTQDFIGSVGGSLGLFMGFSFFSYVNTFLEKIFEI